jgi:MFS-type transporter involved in bile tolerance (Atg22 family)
MFKRIAFTVFNAAVALVGAAAAVWLTISGHTLEIGGLLLAMGAILGAVIFGFRLAEGFGPDHLSIWAGPLWSIRPAATDRGKNGDALRKAA